MHYVLNLVHLRESHPDMADTYERESSSWRGAS